jgi:hypothetical protein
MNIFESINNNNQMSVQTIAALPESNPYKSLDKKDYEALLASSD